MPTIATSPTETAADLGSRFRQVRSFTEALAEPLSAEDQTVQTVPDVSPTKWHRAHTTWFFETFVLQPHQPGYQVVDPSYGYLFNSYYEAVGPRHARPQRGLLSRPGVAEIAAYRAAVDEAVAALLAADDVPGEVESLVALGLHHEQQHQELLLMDIKHVLAANPVQPAYVPYVRSPAAPAGSGPGPAGAWIDHPGGLVEVGWQGHGFSFDNESPRHDVVLRPFTLQAALVTCGEWLAFMDDGGYRRAELWMSDGWAAVQSQGWTAPGYWAHGPGGWRLQTLGGPRPVDGREPVCHVSWYEADAFARWAGRRLPTEAEWEVVATERTGGRPDGGVPGGTPGLDLPGARGPGLHPSPPGDRPDAGSGDGDREGDGGGSADEQWFGAVWQWTASPYAAYPGYHPAEGAVGEYNGKFMVNQHVLRGGACVTPAGHSRLTYRNFFAPGSRWPFTGLRLADDR